MDSLISEPCSALFKRVIELIYGLKKVVILCLNFKELMIELAVVVVFTVKKINTDPLFQLHLSNIAVLGLFAGL